MTAEAATAAEAEETAAEATEEEVRMVRAVVRAAVVTEAWRWWCRAGGEDGHEEKMAAVREAVVSG